MFSNNKGLLFGGGGGITLGSLIAVALSWGTNCSILWAIVHFFCSWGYVVYYILVRPHGGC